MIIGIQLDKNLQAFDVIKIDKKNEASCSYHKFK